MFYKFKVSLINFVTYTITTTAITSN